MSICNNNILEIIGSFAGLSLKDDRRYKKPTCASIRIRGLNRKLDHWEPIYQKVSDNAIISIKYLCREEIDCPIEIKLKHAWRKKNLEIIDYLPLANKFSGPFCIVSPDDLTTIALKIRVYDFFGNRYFIYTT